MLLSCGYYVKCSIACHSEVDRKLLVVAWAFLWYSRWLPGRCYADAEEVLACYCAVVIGFQFCKNVATIWLLQCSEACYSAVAMMMLVVAGAFLWYSRWLPGYCYTDAEWFLACYCAVVIVLLVAAWTFLFSCYDVLDGCQGVAIWLLRNSEGSFFISFLCGC